MNITKSVSEKITSKDRATDQFRSLDFYAGRTITVPDNAPLELIQLKERELDLDLRKQVLTNFVLEGVMTPETLQKTLEPYKLLLARAQEAWDAAQAAEQTA